MAFVATERGEGGGMVGLRGVGWGWGVRRDEESCMGRDVWGEIYGERYVGRDMWGGWEWWLW